MQLKTLEIKQYQSAWLGGAQPKGIALPRYFFDYRDGLVMNDDVGIELADLAAAREVAIGVLKDLMREAHPDGPQVEQEVIIRAEDGTHLLKAMMTFRCVYLV